MESRLTTSRGTAQHPIPGITRCCFCLHAEARLRVIGRVGALSLIVQAMVMPWPIGCARGPEARVFVALGSVRWHPARAEVGGEVT